MQNWVTVDEAYLNYLRAAEPRIPHSDYGANKLKPFFGVLFERGDLVYVTQISHAQPRHEKMKNALDFIKIHLPDTDAQRDRLVAVVNLNYMFPVHKHLIQPLQYRDIEKHRTFSSEREKSMYIGLLRKELAQINLLNIDTKAQKLYDLKQRYPNDKVALRCIDFCGLEKAATAYWTEQFSPSHAIPVVIEPQE